MVREMDKVALREDMGSVAIHADKFSYLKVCYLYAPGDSE